MKRLTSGCPQREGLTLIEVLVTIVILAVVSVAVVGVLPGITRTTAAGSQDVVQTQRMASALERIGDAWLDGDAFDAGEVDGLTLTAFVQAQVGDTCDAAATPSADGDRVRVVITCDAAGTLPAQSLRQEFGDPR